MSSEKHGSSTKREPFQIGKKRPSYGKVDIHIRVSREKAKREREDLMRAHRSVAKFRALARLAEKGRLVDERTENHFRVMGEGVYSHPSRPREFGSKNIVRRLLRDAFSSHSSGIYFWADPKRMEKYSELLAPGPREVAIRIVKEEMKACGIKRNPERYSLLRDFLSFLTFTPYKK